MISIRSCTSVFFRDGIRVGELSSSEAACKAQKFFIATLATSSFEGWPRRMGVGAIMPTAITELRPPTNTRIRRRNADEVGNQGSRA